MANPAACETATPTGDQLLQQLLGERINRWTAQLAQAFAMTVQAGPFKGMILPTKASWSGGYLAPKLLGSYEAELHEAIEKALARRPSVVINVGCAEGYYAIGLARRLPKAHVHAFDVSEDAQAACASAAELNRVADRVHIHGLCSGADLVAITAGVQRALVVMDCEGGEREMLDAETVDQLGHCDIVVELHDFVDRTITASMTDRLSRSHKSRLLREGARDAAQHAILAPLGTFDRGLLVCEFRPEVMHWMVAWSR